MSLFGMLKCPYMARKHGVGQSVIDDVTY